MIEKIVNTFYTLAKEHKLIKTFKYDYLDKAGGVGSDKYPMLFLEENIFMDVSKVNDGMVRATVNFDIELTPQNLENFDIPQPTPMTCQQVAYSIALNMISKLKNDFRRGDNEDVDVVRYNIITNRQWTDDSAVGVRVSLELKVRSDINYCNLEEHFDPNKELTAESLLLDFETEDAVGCNTDFGYKLPKIKF